jgi:hypothetical protein
MKTLIDGRHNLPISVNCDLGQDAGSLSAAGKASPKKKLIEEFLDKGRYHC